MGTRGNSGGGSASRVGDYDVDLSDRWDWSSIPRLLSSACLFFCSGGCFGCCDKTVKKLGELSKTLITHDQLTVGEPFWSTTTIDVSQADLKGFPPIETAPWNFDEHESESSHSHRLVITESGKIVFPQPGSSPRLTLPESGSIHELPESVNPGRILWEQIREEWTEIKRLRPKVKQVREPVLSWSAAYQTCLVTNKSFPRPVPLYEVVDFFADMWEESGMYDI
ncbi:hypothetical protein QOZ80_1BG0060070 [Eleusine coracana subsp. coracana]|nr:hypothetical protein QOZ80_1BG0060070 [Eleusine coracana subsp. coracana]